MLKTIYSDNKINELPEIQSPYYKDVTMFGIKQLRSSLSPQKVKTSKKFFYSIRNKSIKKLEDQSSAQHELESLIRKEKIILMAQRTNINDIILPGADIPVRQAEIMSFPTIDVKRVSEGDVRHNSLRKKYEKRGLIDLIDFRNGY